MCVEASSDGVDCVFHMEMRMRISTTQGMNRCYLKTSSKHIVSDYVLPFGMGCHIVLVHPSLSHGVRRIATTLIRVAANCPYYHFCSEIAQGRISELLNFLFAKWLRQESLITS